MYDYWIQYNNIKEDLSSNGNFNFNTTLNVDNDLLDNFSWGIEIDQSLVDAHSMSWSAK